MDQDAKDAINEVKKDTKEALGEVKRDTKDALNRIEGSMATHFDQQRDRAKIMFEKLDDVKDQNTLTREKLAEHVQQDTRDFGKIQKIVGEVALNQQTLNGSVGDLVTAKRAEEKEKKDEVKAKRKWMWGIIASIIGALVVAAILTFLGLK